MALLVHPVAPPSNVSIEVGTCPVASTSSVTEPLVSPPMTAASFRPVTVMVSVAGAEVPASPSSAV